MAKIAAMKILTTKVNDDQWVLGDLSGMSWHDRQAYLDVALRRAGRLAESIVDGKILYAAYELLLRYVLGTNYRGNEHINWSHDTAAVLYIRLREVGFDPSQVVLCIGETHLRGIRLDRSWVEFRGQVFDVAFFDTMSIGGHAGGPVFADLDLATNTRSSVEYGVPTSRLMHINTAMVYQRTLAEYQVFQELHGFMPIVDLMRDVYGADGRKLIEGRCRDVYRVWRNPLLNPVSRLVSQPGHRYA